MKRSAIWLCATLAVAVALVMFYWYGVTLGTLLVAALLLICPFGVIWLTVRIARQSEGEIETAIRGAPAQQLDTVSE